jgi:hypothetical protein
MKCAEANCKASIDNGDALYNCGDGKWKCNLHSGKPANEIAELIARKNNKKGK